MRANFGRENDWPPERTRILIFDEEIRQSKLRRTAIMARRMRKLEELSERPAGMRFVGRSLSGDEWMLNEYVYTVAVA